MQELLIVSLYYCSLSQSLKTVEHLFSYLSPDEKDKSLRFVFKKDQHAYIISRGVLRCLIARFLECHPSTLSFCYTSTGKPFLFSDVVTHPFYFNLSHSADIVFYALSPDREIGVDVEYCENDVEILDLAKQYFHPQEMQILSSLPTLAQKIETFYIFWTRKEAYLKAIGSGLVGIDLCDLNVSTSPTILLTENPTFSYWKVISYPFLDNYACSLAIEIKSKDEAVTISHTPLLCNPRNDF